MFTMLNPTASGHTQVHTKGRRENNRSCVLRVEAGRDSVLLSGDIEQAAEQEMLQRLAEQLPADVLVVPHHGSKTSSSTAFVEGVAPVIALFPVGYRNRYGFPKPLIVQRYRDRHIRLFDTASHGAIELRLGGALGLQEIQGYRQRAARYWHDTPLETAPSATLSASGGSATLLQ